jgi:hypothetical protein
MDSMLHGDRQDKYRKNFVRDQYIPEIVSRIRDFFISHYNGKYNNITTYVVSPPYILNVLSFFKKRKIYHRIKSTIKYCGLNFIIHCPFQCDKILIKKNIRVFGFPDTAKTTLKIQGFSRFMHGNEIAKEIEIRNRLINISSLTIKIPKIYKFNVFPLSWFIEEYLQGITPTIQLNKALIVEFLENQLVEFYKIFVRPERLVETLKRLHIPFDSLFQFWPSTNADILQRYKLCYWPISICHNDLSLGNMLLNDKELYVLDWEMAGENPIAFDFENISQSKLVLINSSTKALRKINRNLCLEESTLIPPKIQILLASLIKIVDLVEHKDKRIQYHELIRGLNYKKSVDKVKSEINSKYKNIIYLLHEIKEMGYERQ